ncbi:MAG: DUF2771 family protein [Gordonia sp. (in: high G+C Gram-positive bacteria)]|uniref:DUF2771 family protein n=1 Tax=Gordonia sp. (in: high G+C Gram-positive bacteria) TaxID=84139 RepID=UPI003BB5ACB8
MTLQPADKKALAILTAAVVAALAIIVVATTLLVRGHVAPPPSITVGTDRSLERVEPTVWCDLKLTECTPRPMNLAEIAVQPVTVLPVAVGSTLSLSVPHQIFEGPWLLTATYATPEGLDFQQWIHRSGTMATQRLASTPDRVLLGIEVKPFSAVIYDTADSLDQGEIGFRAHYAVRTAPTGYVVSTTP